MQRQQLCGIDEESLVFLEALRLDGVGELDGDVVVPEVAEYLVDLADLLLVLEVDGRVEVGHIGLRHLDDEVILAGVGHVADGDDAFGRTEVALEAASAAAAASSTSAAATSTTAKTTPAPTTTASIPSHCDLVEKFDKFSNTFRPVPHFPRAGFWTKLVY